MRVRSTDPRADEATVRRWIAGLPEARSYEVRVRPLRYRTRPHLAAYTEFDEQRITLQVPEPFLPFGEIVQYGAVRAPGRRMRFLWLSEGLTFRTPREVVRFLYCHEWYHWYLKEELGRASAAETACDRFALANYRRRLVTLDDARDALRRSPGDGLNGAGGRAARARTAGARGRANLFKGQDD